jgi:uncharacterized protein (DUF433 family)
MIEPPRLSPKSLQVLKLIAAGHSYSQIVDSSPGLNYHDIFFAAEEAVWIDEKISAQPALSATAEPPNRPTEISAMEMAKRTYPNAYMPWSADDDAQLADMHGAGASKAEMAAHFQRQPSAIRSRLSKLGLI